jgi:hypothetical protein
VDNSAGPNDVASLYDTPGNDAYVAASTYAYLQGGGQLAQANGFRSVYGYSTTGSDQAYLLGTGTAADTYVSRGGSSYLYGDAFFALESNFGYVYVNPSARR